MKAFLRALVVPASVLMCIVAWPRGLSAQISLTPTFCIGATPCVTTYHNDNNRDGVNPNETQLSPNTTFANLQAMTYATDGLIYAQPLYIEGLYGSNLKVGSVPLPMSFSSPPRTTPFMRSKHRRSLRPAAGIPAGCCP